MPLYEYKCSRCKGIKESVRPIISDAPECCGEPMSKGPGSIAWIRIKGVGYPSRKKWMDNFNPSQPTEFKVGSLHGEKY